MFLLGLAHFFRCFDIKLAVWEDGWTANKKNLISESSFSFCCLLEAAPSPCSQPHVHAGNLLLSGYGRYTMPSLVRRDHIVEADIAVAFED